MTATTPDPESTLSRRRRDSELQAADIRLVDMETTNPTETIFNSERLRRRNYIRMLRRMVASGISDPTTAQLAPATAEYRRLYSREPEED